MNATNPSAAQADLEELIKLRCAQVARIAASDDRTVAAQLLPAYRRDLGVHLARNLPADASDAAATVEMLKYAREKPGHYKKALPDISTLGPQGLMDLHNTLSVTTPARRGAK